MILGMQLNADDYIDIFDIDSHCSPSCTMWLLQFKCCLKDASFELSET